MERLQKVIAQAGITSRRKAESLITAGRVKVNGEIITELGVKVSVNDTVEVDGVPIDKEEPKYILLYKPRNYISSISDPHDRPVVIDLIKDIDQRIYPVGRLDFDTTGLLILTNDGDFANLLMHPSFHINKTYIAKIDGIPNKEDMQKLREGLYIDGKKTAPAWAEIINTNPSKNMSIVKLRIHEGWNHQVKKMFEAIGYRVQKLKRENISFLGLGKMNPGDYRELTAFEVDKLKKEALNYNGSNS